MTGNYSAALVGFSIVIAMLASFAALNLASQVTSAVGKTRVAWLVGGATVMGIGIWSMHFVGMLAFHLPVAIGYTLPLLLLSVVVAIAASLLALVVVSRDQMTIRTLITAGVLMGAAICGMHYVGMASMSMNASVSYDPIIVAASIAIAIGASIAALWLAYRFRSEASYSAGSLKALAAVVMGIAISGMHYTGMAAARFTPSARAGGLGNHILATDQLGEAVVVGALAMIALAIVGTVIDRRVLSERLEHAATLAAQAQLLRQQKEELKVQAEYLEAQTLELERALAETKLAREAERIADRARMKFMNMVSHELRTPVGAIGGYLELLLLGLRGPMAEAQLSDLRRIESNQRHLVLLLNDLLDLAKLESGQMPVNLTECGINEILESARPMFEPQLKAKGIAYHRDIEESTPTIIGDPARVQQILINLIANSIKFTPPNGSIKISANRRQDDVDVRICDSGPGITADAAATLFAPFVQLGDQHGGTGLGLAISRELARAMGGELAFDTDMSPGATFVLSLHAAHQMPSTAGPRLDSSP